MFRRIKWTYSESAWYRSKWIHKSYSVDTSLLLLINTIVCFVRSFFLSFLFVDAYWFERHSFVKTCFLTTYRFTQFHWLVLWFLLLHIVLPKQLDYSNINHLLNRKNINLYILRHHIHMYQFKSINFRIIQISHRSM